MTDFEIKSTFYQSSACEEREQLGSQAAALQEEHLQQKAKSRYRQSSIASMSSNQSDNVLLGSPIPGSADSAYGQSPAVKWAGMLD